MASIKKPATSRGRLGQRASEFDHAWGLIGSEFNNSQIWFQALAVEVLRDESAWLVRYRQHGWLHGSRREALADAQVIADGFGVGLLVNFT